ncbi:MAG: M48 family peptidase, partial [Pseudolabrys sp.]
MSLNGTPIRTRRKAPAAQTIALLTAIAVGAAGGGPAATPARAQDSTTRGMPDIRDAEIELLWREYAQPILHAAGLAKQNVRVAVLSDRSFNAFVM